MRLIKSFFIVLGFVLANVMFAGNAEEIEQMIRQNISATQAEDISAVLQTMHPDSLLYAKTKQVLSGLFQSYDLKYTLISYRYIAEDGAYAMARVLQRTEKLSGPKFMDNDLDMVQIFKRDQGGWKLWSQAVVTVNAVKP